MIDLGLPPHIFHFSGPLGYEVYGVGGPWEMKFMGSGSLGRVGNEIHDPTVDPMLRRADAAIGIRTGPTDNGRWGSRQ